MSIDIALVVAIGQDSVIGNGGALPWRLSSDMKRFKADTMGKPIIMGRKTYEGIGRPLPGRDNIVISRDPNFDAPGCDVAASIDSALDVARSRACSSDAGEICVIGGGEIYRQCIARADRLYVTHVEGRFDGDTHFPVVEPEDWKAVSQQRFPRGEKDSHATVYTVYERLKPAD